MSIAVMTRIFWTDIPSLSYTDPQGNKETVSGSVCKLVLLAIADSGGDFGENSYQSYRTLSKKASANRYTVVRAIHALIENGYLVLTGVSQYGTNNFMILVDKLGDAPKKAPRNGRPARDAVSDDAKKTSQSSNETSQSSNETSQSSQHDSYIPKQNRPRFSSKKFPKESTNQPAPYPAPDGL